MSSRSKQNVDSREPKQRQYYQAAFPKTHQCNLNTALEEELLIPRPSPAASGFAKFIYKIRRLMMVNRDHPEAMVYFVSNAALKKERRRQLLNPKYRFIIHPFSKLNFGIEICCVIMWSMLFYAEPMDNTFYGIYMENPEDPWRVHMKRPFQIINLVCNILFVFSTIINFFVGYTENTSKEVILDHRKIAKKYLGTYFIFDMVASVQNIVSFFLMDTEGGDQIILWQLYMFRYVRIFTMLRFFSRLLIFCGLKESLTKCILATYCATCILHWMTCFFFVFPHLVLRINGDVHNSFIIDRTIECNKEDIPYVHFYVECLMCIVCHFFGAGKGSIQTKAPEEQIILAFVTVMGAIIHFYVIAEMLFLFGTINISENKYDDLIYQLSEYMVTKKLPTELRKRLFLYYEKRFQNKFFMEDQILLSLSEHLRYEVVLYNCQHLIDKMRVFQGVSKSVIGSMIGMMKSEIFLVDDILIKPEVINDFVYFISCGTVTVLLPPNNVEVFHLEDGHHFGELSIVFRRTGEKTQYIVKVLETIEVFFMTINQFAYCLQAFPEVVDRLQRNAAAKMELINSAQVVYEETNDVISDLRSGRVVRKGIVRR